MLLDLVGGLIPGIALLTLPITDGFTASMAVVGVTALGSYAATAGLSTAAVVAGRRRAIGRVMGGFHSVASFGMIAVSLAAGLIYDTVGIQAMFIGARFVTLGLLPVVWSLLRLPPKQPL